MVSTEYPLCFTVYSGFRFFSFYLLLYPCDVEIEAKAEFSNSVLLPYNKLRQLLQWSGSLCREDERLGKAEGGACRLVRGWTRLGRKGGEAGL